MTLEGTPDMSAQIKTAQPAVGEQPPQQNYQDMQRLQGFGQMAGGMNQMGQQGQALQAWNQAPPRQQLASLIGGGAPQGAGGKGGQQGGTGGQQYGHGMGGYTPPQNFQPQQPYGQRSGGKGGQRQPQQSQGGKGGGAPRQQSYGGGKGG
jgi:hypothetical protein